MIEQKRSAGVLGRSDLVSEPGRVLHEVAEARAHLRGMLVLAGSDPPEERHPHPGRAREGGLSGSHSSDRRGLP